MYGITRDKTIKRTYSKVVGTKWQLSACSFGWWLTAGAGLF
jgi:hypothetical protein